MTKRLLEPILEGGVRYVHFFNGRRLTAEDLQAEQAAGRLERERLGLGVGAGIVYGFEVQETAERFGQGAGPGVVLKVRAGTAINRLGQAVALPHDQQVALVPPEGPLPEGAGLFGPCEGGSAPVPVAGSGAYILVVSPASGFEGRVPMAGFECGGGVAGCGSRYAVAGVRFGVVPVPLLGGPGSLLSLQNRLAHRCFGTEALLSSARSPSGRPAGDGLEQAAPDLAPCDVPLALFYWSGGAIRFLDHWAVRRRVTAPFPASSWAPYAADGRKAVGEAIFLQFQEEIESLVAREANPRGIAAHERFRFLPPAGFLPVGSRGVDPAVFFSRFRRVIPLEADPAFLREWVHRSFYVDPIDVEAPPPVGIFAIPGVEDFLFFARQDVTDEREGRTKPEPPAEEPVRVQPGAIDVRLSVASDPAQPTLTLLEAGSAGAGATFAPAASAVLAPATHATATYTAETLTPAGGEAVSSGLRINTGADRPVVTTSALRVAAVDELGTVYEGRIVPAVAGFGEEGRRPVATVEIGPLNPGMYTVVVRSRIFRDASRRVVLGEGARERVDFQLVFRGQAEEPPAVVRVPERLARADWIDTGWYSKIAVMEAYVNPHPLPPRVREWDAVTDPPPDIQAWLVSWADWAAARLPGGAVDPGDIRILVDPAYAPDSVVDEPYAYIEFGEGGANVPVVLVANHNALEGPVSVQRAGLPGVDQDIGMRLWQLGAAEVDIAASAWTGLLRDAGLPVDAAAAVVADARRRAAELKTSVDVVPGVDAGTRAVLVEKGIDAAVKLANADPVRLEKELGINRLQADVIVEGARAVVGDKAWSLRDPELGLTEEQVRKLEEVGVGTKGDLAARPAEEIADKAGIAVEQAGAIVEKARKAQDVEQIKAAEVEKSPVTVLGQAENLKIDAALARNLAQSGVKSVKDAAAAEVEKIAAVTGDHKVAQSLIEAARALLRTQR